MVHLPFPWHALRVHLKKKPNQAKRFLSHLQNEQFRDHLYLCGETIFLADSHESTVPMQDRFSGE